MYKYSKKSLERLNTCHPLIQKVFNEIITLVDVSILYGYRSITEQMELYKQGRELDIGRWKVKDKNKIVTYCDGVYNKSKHNYFPALAIDVAPYPFNWHDDRKINEKKFYDLSLIIKDIVARKNIPLKWGGDFKTFKGDFPHWELKFK